MSSSQRLLIRRSKHTSVKYKTTFSLPYSRFRNYFGGHRCSLIFTICFVFCPQPFRFLNRIDCRSKYLIKYRPANRVFWYICYTKLKARSLLIWKLCAVIYCLTSHLNSYFKHLNTHRNIMFRI